MVNIILGIFYHSFKKGNGICAQDQEETIWVCMEGFTREGIKGEFGIVDWDQMCKALDNRTDWQSQVGLQVTRKDGHFSLAGADEEKTQGELTSTGDRV